MTTIDSETAGVSPIRDEFELGSLDSHTFNRALQKWSFRATVVVSAFKIIPTMLIAWQRGHQIKVVYRWGWVPGVTMVTSPESFKRYVSFSMWCSIVGVALVFAVTALASRRHQRKLSNVLELCGDDVELTKFEGWLGATKNKGRWLGFLVAAGIPFTTALFEFVRNYLVDDGQYISSMYHWTALAIAAVPVFVLIMANLRGGFSATVHTSEIGQYAAPWFRRPDGAHAPSIVEPTVEIDPFGHYGSDG